MLLVAKALIEAKRKEKFGFSFNPKLAGLWRTASYPMVVTGFKRE